MRYLTFILIATTFLYGCKGLYKLASPGFRGAINAIKQQDVADSTVVYEPIYTASSNSNAVQAILPGNVLNPLPAPAALDSVVKPKPKTAREAKKKDDGKTFVIIFLTMLAIIASILILFIWLLIAVLRSLF